jgi:hypothetical protein
MESEETVLETAKSIPRTIKQVSILLILSPFTFLSVYPFSSRDARGKFDYLLPGEQRCSVGMTGKE